MPKPTTPNLDLPIRFEDGDLALNEMDTAVDFKTKAEVLMRYSPNDRPDLPEFGARGLLGKLAPIDLSDLQRSLSEWIPEGNFRLSESGSYGDPSARRVQVEVDEPSVDQ